MVEPEVGTSRRPGPRRPVGAPVGPQEVRRVVLDAAALLFAERGVDGVSLRQIASAADVHHALIERYIGNRDELIRAVFEDLSRQLGESFLASPLSDTGFGLDSVGGRWTLVAASLATTGHVLDVGTSFNPVEALAETIVENYGLEPRAARLRAAQIVAAGVGWRVLEEYLVGAAGLDDVPVEELRDELVRSHRRLGATPWPSPPDPTPHSR